MQWTCLEKLIFFECSEDESDEEEEDIEKKNEVGCNRKKQVKERKNEAGETQLHLAAKRGDLAGIKRFIRLVNVIVYYYFKSNSLLDLFV
jgi:ankyrin repeat protein